MDIVANHLDSDDRSSIYKINKSVYKLKLPKIYDTMNTFIYKPNPETFKMILSNKQLSRSIFLSATPIQYTDNNEMLKYLM